MRFERKLPGQKYWLLHRFRRIFFSYSFRHIYGKIYQEDLFIFHNLKKSTLIYRMYQKLHVFLLIAFSKAKLKIMIIYMYILIIFIML